ncbi:hypothetical protein ACH5RR_001296 [Cinchona calisaya]|uniref:Uncharacterized protein n=1 Tax=Cinchona calisaya TaxID=153742 RepID=A0ABD3B303_9GENT
MEHAPAKCSKVDPSNKRKSLWMSRYKIYQSSEALKQWDDVNLLSDQLSSLQLGARIHHAPKSFADLVSRKNSQFSIQEATTYKAEPALIFTNEEIALISLPFKHAFIGNSPKFHNHDGMLVFTLISSSLLSHHQDNLLPNPASYCCMVDAIRPSVNATIDRFESQTPKSIDSSNLFLEAHRKINVQHLNNELTILQNQFETEKKRGKTLNQQRKVGETRHWWEAPIEELNLEQLEEFNLALLELQKNVKSELRKIVFEHSNQKGNLGRLNPYGIDLFGINAREIGPSSFYRFHYVVPGNKAFTPFVGPSRLNTCISSKDGYIVSKIESGPSSFVAFNPNATEFGTTTIHPLLPNEFNNGYVSVTQF